MIQITKEERDSKIQELQNEKAKLLDKHGLFGGGIKVNIMHKHINAQLENLGVGEYETLSYDEWITPECRGKEGGGE